ncbi:MAG: class I tRNA ligase family protein, partial [Mycoplasmataceae bacterium]|nr:class I tRNA ligase family protein [Mycoplasmataceae bacterium]
MKNIYVCGPTVYSKAHIGNLRPIITFDIFIRSLEALGNKVNLIHNITDIDDKIITAAAKEKTTEVEISSKYKKYYLDILERSNVNIPENMPGVVENMESIVEYIAKLVELGNAYEANGSVYFDITSVEGYGKLSNRDINKNIDKENKEKKHQADFAIWKATKEGVKYDSPWGKGRPGWHTECAVFINEIVKGESLDIHGGGIDLLFPHHENENIQYEAVNKKEIAKEWRHIGKLNIDGEKMSKSIGNIMDASEFMDEHGEDVL